MKVSELEGAVLDLFVGMADERHVKIFPQLGCVEYHITGKKSIGKIKNIYSPSTDWSQGGPIIERERIKLEPVESFSQADSEEYPDGAWYAEISNKYTGGEGETSLIAAMRCYVASKYGDEVPDQ